MTIGLLKVYGYIIAVYYLLLLT